MKLNRVGLGAGVLIAAVALAACSSSGTGGGSGTTAPSTSGSSDTSSAATTSASAGASGSCSSGTLDAAGSTAQTNAMTAWINAYTKKCSGAKINYNPTGSGAGITSFIAKDVQLAGSDSPLDPKKSEPTKAATACGSTALDLPMVVGPIAIGYNLSGVTKLNLTPTLLAQIFTGKITAWDDAAIKAKNSGVTLPSTKISVVYRSDSSGTTQNFEKYLAATAPTVFTATPAKDNANTVFKGQGAAKSQGVASAIKTTAGSIGYDEYSFAVNDSLQTAQINGVNVSKDSASAAAGAATVAGTGNDLTLKLDYAPSASGAYPLILVTYEVVCTKYADAAKGTFVKNFLTYTSGDGQSLLAGLGYAPLPSALLAKVQASVAKIS